MGLGALHHRDLQVEITDTLSGESAVHNIVTGYGVGYGDWSNRAPYGGGMGIPGAMRAALLVSDLLGSTPWHAFADGPDGLATQVTPTPALLAQPAPPEYAVNTWSAAALDLIWHGNAIGLKVGRAPDGSTDSMLPISAENVHVKRVLRGDGIPLPIGTIAYYITPYDIVDGGDQVAGRWYASDEVIHIKGPHRAGALRGMGVLECQPVLLRLAEEQRRQAAAATGAGIPTGVLKSENPDLDEVEAAGIKSAWMTAQSSRTVAVLNATTSFEALAWNPTEAQLVEARKLTLHELALAFGLEPSWLGVSGDSMTYSNVEQKGINLVRFSINGHLARFEAALSAALPRTQHARANMDAVLRADTLTRYQAHQIAITAGFRTVDEVRALENLPPLTAEQKAELKPPEPPPGPKPGAAQQRARGAAARELVRRRGWNAGDHPRDSLGRFRGSGASRRRLSDWDDMAGALAGMNRSDGLSAIWSVQGFDAPPEIVGSKEFAALPADYKRVAIPVDDRAMAMQLRYGAHVTPATGPVADGVQGSSNVDGVDGVQAALRPDARVVGLDALFAEADAQGLQDDDDMSDALGDPGRLAAALGYDAVAIPEADGSTSYAIQNRAALVVEDPAVQSAALPPAPIPEPKAQPAPILPASAPSTWTPDRLDRATLRDTYKRVGEPRFKGAVADVAIHQNKATGAKIVVKKAPNPMDAGNEIITARLAEIMGAKVPAVRQVDLNTTAHDFVEGHPAMREMLRGGVQGGYEAGRARWAALRDGPDGDALAIFDAITGQEDRHANNVMVGEDGQLFGIDHGMSFGTIRTPSGGVRFPSLFGDPAQRPAVTVARLEAMRPALEASRADFAAAYPKRYSGDVGQFHDAMMSNFEALVEHVRDTREANGLDP